VTFRTQGTAWTEHRACVVKGISAKTYEYACRDDRAVRRTGICQAESEQDVLAWLRDQRLTPIEVRLAQAKTEKEGSRHPRRRVKSEQMASFCWQLNTMIAGGVPMADAIETIAEDIDNPYLRHVLQQVCERMKAGETLSDSVSKFPKVFNPLCLAMIMAGEAGGSLPTVLHRLAVYFEGRDRLARKVKGAMAYPVFVLFFVSFIVVVMMVLIIPRFQVIFDQIQGEIPAFTRGFVAVYETITQNAPILLICLAAVICGGAAYVKTKKGHERFSRILLSIPLIGKILSQAFVAMFCRTMSTLLSAGVSVLDGLTILSGMTSNDVIRAAIIRTRDNVVEGAGISVSMAAAAFFPNMVSKMIQVGEESGSLPLVLDKTSDYYEKKVDSSIASLTGFIEPAMIIIVGAIVLTVVLALYLPVFSISNMKS